MGSNHRRLYTALTIVSAVSFVGFGIGYLTSPRMRGEFTRYGMAPYRVPAACLQLVGGAGQLVGLKYPWLGTAAAAGLAGMMLVAVSVRVSIDDSAAQTVPALAYLGLCLYLVRASRRR